MCGVDEIAFQSHSHGRIFSLQVGLLMSWVAHWPFDVDPFWFGLHRVIEARGSMAALKLSPFNARVSLGLCKKSVSQAQPWLSTSCQTV